MLPGRVPGYNKPGQGFAERSRCHERATSAPLCRDGSPNADEETAAPPRLEVDTPEWSRLNRRRGELIFKKYPGGLTPDEEAELERLQAITSEVIERTFPRPLPSPEVVAFIRRGLGPAEDAPIP